MFVSKFNFIFRDNFHDFPLALVDWQRRKAVATLTPEKAHVHVTEKLLKRSTTNTQSRKATHFLVASQVTVRCWNARLIRWLGI